MSPVKLADIEFVGKGLVRPECVLATANGRIYTADWRGGVAVIEPDGEQWLLRDDDAAFELKPNGICLQPDGSFLIAHLGEAEGGVFRLDQTGQLTPFLTEIEGEFLPPTNYVHRDALGRIWRACFITDRRRFVGIRSGLTGHQFGEPKIGDSQPSPAVKQQIFRLDVTMHDSFVVRVREGVAKLWNDLQSFRRR